MFGLKAKDKVTTKGLEARAEAVFNALHAHNVFGDIDTTRLEVERQGFKTAVIEHALGENTKPLEIGYPSTVRLIIHTEVFAGKALFGRVTAYVQPFGAPNKGTDCKELNRSIILALGEFAAW